MNKLAFCHTSQAIRLIVEYVALATMERKNKASPMNETTELLGNIEKTERLFVAVAIDGEMCAS